MWPITFKLLNSAIEGGGNIQQTYIFKIFGNGIDNLRKWDFSVYLCVHAWKSARAEGKLEGTDLLNVHFISTGVFLGRMWVNGDEES